MGLSLPQDHSKSLCRLLQGLVLPALGEESPRDGAHNIIGSFSKGRALGADDDNNAGDASSPLSCRARSGSLSGTSSPRSKSVGLN